MSSQTKFTHKHEHLKRALHQNARAHVRRAAEEHAEVSRIMCPVGPPHEDGTPHTRDTIRVETDEQGNPVVIAEGAAMWINYGTVHRPAQPFWEPGEAAALDELKRPPRKLYD